MPKNCPCADELRRWLEDAQDAPSLDGHVETCPDCQRAVEELLAGTRLGTGRGDDPARMVALLGSAASFLKRLEEAAPPEAGSSVNSESHSTAIEASPAPAPSLAGYEIVGELGKGGMGVVWLGRHRHLRREVAIKVMKPEFAVESDLVRRFIEEARLTSQLQHPAIPPVHELGELANGPPYFVMKLVKGRTLDDLLKARCRPAEDLPRFLGVFEQVCQALAYAHSKGVIHRDLKPGNVMVGAFGEVQVMDWGLAKELRIADCGLPIQESASSEAGTLSSNPRSAIRDPQSEETQAGSVLGTYAYMPREQARGEVAQLDRRCDVFGLGAMLCEILTGQPPYVGTDQEVKAQAQAGQLTAAHARLAGCGADAELVELAKCCLSARAPERPADAVAVAAALTAYLAGVQERLRKAELERAAAEARSAEAKATAAAERKARRRTLALATALLALLAVCAGGALLVRQQVDRRQAEQLQRAREKRRGIESALEKASALRQQARWNEAGAVLDQARQALDAAGPDDLRLLLNDAQAELVLVNRLDSIRQRFTFVAGKMAVRTMAHDYSEAFREAGLGEVGDDEETMAKRLRAMGVSAPLVVALDDWALVAEEPARSWLLRVARLAAPDGSSNRFRDPAVWQDVRRLQALAQEALREDGTKLGEPSPQLLAFVGLMLRESPHAIPLLRAAQRRHPNDFWLSQALGTILINAKQIEEAVGFCQVAVALRPDSAIAHNNLGIAMAYKKDRDAAIAAFRKAIDLDHEYAEAHFNLGLEMRAKEDLLAAVAEYRKAIELDPKHIAAHYHLGTALHLMRNPDSAIAEYREAIELDPKDPLFRYMLGVALRDKKDLNGAIAAFHKANQLNPKLVHVNNALGVALHDKKDLTGAIVAYRKAIELDPKHVIAHYNLGNALYDKKDMTGAIAAYRTAIELDPKNIFAHHRLGFALLQKNDLAAAITAFRQVIHLQPNHGNGYYNLANALRDNKDLDGAVGEFRRAVELAPDFAEAHYKLGQVLLTQGRFAEALAALRRGHQLGSLRSGWPHPSGERVRECQQLVERDRLLTAFLDGKAERVSAAQLLELASLCQLPCKRLHATAARLAAEAFSLDAKWANDLERQHRYNAARSSALAAAGQGNDARHLPDKVQAMLRRQALGWLRADLALYTKLAQGQEPTAKQMVRQRLAHWRKDPDLAPFRDKSALDKLPEDEGKDWRRFWDEVAALLKKVE